MQDCCSIVESMVYELEHHSKFTKSLECIKKLQRPRAKEFTIRTDGRFHFFPDWQTFLKPTHTVRVPPKTISLTAGFEIPSGNIVWCPSHVINTYRRHTYQRLLNGETNLSNKALYYEISCMDDYIFWEILLDSNNFID